MSRLRFTSAHEVLDTFLSARGDIRPELSDDTPMRYMERLAETSEPDSAIAFCAYMLPRREAVWWGCRCLRMMKVDLSIALPGGLKAAEAWVRRPDDATRRTALEQGMKGNLTTSPAWLALGAGWAGGSMSLGDHAVASLPHLTAKAINASLILALGAQDPSKRVSLIWAAIDDGRRLASGEDVL